MAPGWVPTARVVVLPSHALEGRRLVDGHTRASILVLVARVRVVNSRDLRRKAVRASYVHGRDQRQQKNFWVDARKAGGPRRSEAVSDPAGESERTVDPDSESMSTTGETERATFLIGSLWAVVVEWPLEANESNLGDLGRSQSRHRRFGILAIQGALSLL